jgi:hypothetical protein
VCKCVLLPPGDNPIAVNKYIISIGLEQLQFDVHKYICRSGLWSFDSINIVRTVCDPKIQLITCKACTVLKMSTVLNENCVTDFSLC